MFGLHTPHAQNRIRHAPDLLAERRACHAAIRARIKLVAYERSLSRDEIKGAMSLKHEPLIRVAQEHRLSVDWLLLGKLTGLWRTFKAFCSLLD